MMNKNTVDSNSLYQIICALFCVIVVISNIISAKMISIPLFDNLAVPAGLIVYPLTFLLSDLTTEIFGAGKAKQMIYISLGTAILSFGIIQISLMLPAIDEENQVVFQKVLGINGVLIFSSLIGYLTAQIIDVKLYAQIKKWTDGRWLWLRNNASTLISQMVDTFAVNIIFLYWGLEMEFDIVVRIMLFSYCYKALFSIVNTPLFYLLVFAAKDGQHYWNRGLLGEYITRKAGKYTKRNQRIVNDLTVNKLPKSPKMI